jgi:hypothetical protein
LFTGAIGATDRLAKTKEIALDGVSFHLGLRALLFLISLQVYFLSFESYSTDIMELGAPSFGVIGSSVAVYAAVQGSR